MKKRRPVTCERCGHVVDGDYLESVVIVSLVNLFERDDAMTLDTVTEGDVCAEIVRTRPSALKCLARGETLEERVALHLSACRRGEYADTAPESKHTKGKQVTMRERTKRMESAPLELVPIDEIVVGPRLRMELGRIDELAESIRKVGLIDPILISDGLELILGARRLAAAKMLGWSLIPARKVSGLTAEQRIDLQFSEAGTGLRLTPEEEAKDMKAEGASS